MARESIHGKLGRVRPPRVHITYDVEVGDAIQMKELPFVVGVLADLSGRPDEPLPPVKDRKLVDIDRDNFDAVLKGMKPRVAYRVDNKLADDDSKLGVELRFNGMQDFEPEQVVNQVEPLRKLAEARKKLSDLMAKMDGNDRLVELMDEIIKNSEALQKLNKEAAPEGAGGTGKEEKNG
ncbi:MAG: type VI secretion system contractile sheath small subunit [Deltaproteobacteria bacterium]|nr:type VI secretion system contractile sheath small subunit [Deltaproteobacteria bacterium]MDZ4341937.1 type VI secretion system contractile sheath small subunit [Candidatus Binatia bacterium]